MICALVHTLHHSISSSAIIAFLVASQRSKNMVFRSRFIILHNLSYGHVSIEEAC
jgi:hypothetical protein